MHESEQGVVSVPNEERGRRLATRLRETREYLGLSQQFVADHTAIPRLAISSIENGKRGVAALELDALARLYHYPVDYFLEETFSEPPMVRALAREAHDLTDRDREEVLRFAQFLKSYAGATKRGDERASGDGK